MENLRGRIYSKVLNPIRGGYRKYCPVTYAVDREVYDTIYEGVEKEGIHDELLSSELRRYTSF